jgi:hypothetical protein
MRKSLTLLGSLAIYGTCAEESFTKEAVGCSLKNVLADFTASNVHASEHSIWKGELGRRSVELSGCGGATSSHHWPLHTAHQLSSADESQPYLWIHMSGDSLMRQHFLNLGESVRRAALQKKNVTAGPRL